MSVCDESCDCTDRCLSAWAKEREGESGKQAHHVDVLDNDLVLVTNDAHDSALLALVRAIDNLDLA